MVDVDDLTVVCLQEVICEDLHVPGQDDEVDVFRLEPSEHMSEAEIAAAEMVMMGEFNAQMQGKVEWPAAAPVAQAYLDQMVRANRIRNDRASQIGALLQRASSGSVPAAQLTGLATTLEADVAAIRAGELGGDAERLGKIAEVLRGMAR